MLAKTITLLISERYNGLIHSSMGDSNRTVFNKVRSNEGKNGSNRTEKLYKSKFKAAQIEPL